MDDDLFRVRFWGVRGSVPVSGAAVQRYGGNTACIEMRCGPHTLFFDAGSGIRPAGDALKAAGVDDFDVFFTHCHYDHIIGLPFFHPLYDPNAQVTTLVWSSRRAHDDARDGQRVHAAALVSGEAGNLLKPTSTRRFRLRRRASAA